MTARTGRVAAAFAAAALVLTAVGLSGVGDAPDPHAPAPAIVAWFVDHRDDVLVAAPFGYLGALTVALFAWVLAVAIREAGEVVASRVVAAGGIVVAAYLFVVHVLWTAIAYQVAATSARDAKTLFVVTILAVPVLGTGLALFFGGAAIGAARGHLLPRWWSWLTGVGALVGACALVSFGDGGFFSPDTQQQVEGNVLLVWLLVSAVTLVVTSRSRRRSAT